jgi:hypothetical protein
MKCSERAQPQAARRGGKQKRQSGIRVTEKNRRKNVRAHPGKLKGKDKRDRPSKTKKKEHSLTCIPAPRPSSSRQPSVPLLPGSHHFFLELSEADSLQRIVSAGWGGRKGKIGGREERETHLA